MIRLCNTIHVCMKNERPALPRIDEAKTCSAAGLKAPLQVNVTGCVRETKTIDLKLKKLQTDLHCLRGVQFCSFEDIRRGKICGIWIDGTCCRERNLCTEIEQDNSSASVRQPCLKRFFRRFYMRQSGFDWLRN